MFKLRLLSRSFRNITRLTQVKSYGNFHISEEVSVGLIERKPIVALESTILTHGMPYPENFKTAVEVEAIVRKNNVIPATIGIIKGKVTIGMTTDQLEYLSSKHEKKVKVSKRDLPYVLSKGISGGTTVAATMALSCRAGIPIFVTGGIGGVHRGAEISMDISSDLFELGRTPITVISAGVKSILDIGKTLEYLETCGVCVATYGPTTTFPAFFAPYSKFSSACNVYTVKEAAQLIESRNILGLESGLLIAVPIPDSQSAHGVEIEKIIDVALAEAKSNDITGKDVTPFVLARVQELSQGSSLKANMALIKNNAHIGSLIAVELSNLQEKSFQIDSNSKHSMKMATKGQSVRGKEFTRIAPKTEAKHSERRGRPVVIGGSILDLHITALDDIKMNGSTLQGKIQSSAGGVGRNIADCLARLGCNPLLLSVVGDQEYKDSLLTKMVHMDTSGIKVLENTRSATCAVILDRNRECIFLVGDLEILNKVSVEQIQANESEILKAPVVVLDTNIPVETIEYVFELCSHHKIPVWLEPTDFNRAGRSFHSAKWRGAVLYASPNMNELRVMHRACTGEGVDLSSIPFHLPNSLEETLEECIRLCRPLVNEISTLVVTLGSHGTLVVTTKPENQPLLVQANAVIETGPLRAIHYHPPEPQRIASVSGAGDCLAAGMLAAMLHDHDVDTCMLAGQRAARLSLASHHTVPDTISAQSVLQDLRVTDDVLRRRNIIKLNSK